MRALPTLTLSLPHLRLEGLRVTPLAVWLGGISLLALALRLIWVFYTDTIPLGGDPHWYYVVGINISEGFGFVADRNELWEIPGPGEPTAFWPPGYPFALGALFTVTGESITSAQVLNAVLSAATVPFVYALGRRIFDHRAGLISALLFAVFPNVIAGTPLLFPEPLFGLIFSAALLLIVSVSPDGERNWLPLVALGFLAGLATLTRGQGALLFPIAGVTWLMQSGWRPAIRGVAIAAVVAVAVVAPWTVRNAVEMHAFIPISTNSGAALRVGHNAESIGTTKWTDDDVGGFRMWESLYHPEWEVRGYREYTDLAIDYALTHPVDEVRLAGLKTYHLYRSDSTVIPFLTTLGATPLEPEGMESALRWVLDVAWYALVFAAVLTLPFWVRRADGRRAGVAPRDAAARLLPVTVVVLWTLFHMAFLGEPRYHMPLYPLLIIAAVGGCAAAIGGVRAAAPRIGGTLLGRLRSLPARPSP